MTDAAQPPAKRDAAKVGAILVAAATVAPLTLASEGLVTHTSADPVGIPTACYGHANAQAGKSYTEEQCVDLAAIDLAKAGAAIDPCIKVPISASTRAAFTDFAFNAGPGAFCRSSVAARLNAGDARGACAALSLYVYADHKPLPGLTKRRAAERALCEAGLAEAPQAPSVAVPEPSAPQPQPPAKLTFWARVRSLFA